MKILRVGLVLVAALVVCLGSQYSTAAPLQWTTAVGGNGHWYEGVVVEGGIKWSDSKLGAEARGGYLVSITSAEENTFVWDLVMSTPGILNTYQIGYTGVPQHGPWIGGYQDHTDSSYSEPYGGWKWVSGETFTLASWMYFRASNDDYSGMNWGEDNIHLGLFGPNFTGEWNDRNGENVPTNLPNSYMFPSGYITEYDSNPVTAVPEASSLVGAIIMFTSIGLSKLRFRK